VQLAASDRWQRWQNTSEGQRAAAAARFAGASKLPQQQLQDAVAQQLEGSGMLAGDEAGSKQSAGSSEQALLGAVDKLLAGLDTQGLDRCNLGQLPKDAYILGW
jgi:hypothetical protein